MTKLDVGKLNAISGGCTTKVSGSCTVKTSGGGGGRRGGCRCGDSS